MIQYKLTRQVWNVMGDRLQDETLSINDQGRLGFASYFNRAFTECSYDTPEQCVDALNRYALTDNYYLCELDIDKYCVIKKDDDKFVVTGFEIKVAAK